MNGVIIKNGLVAAGEERAFQRNLLILGGVVVDEGGTLGGAIEIDAAGRLVMP